MTIYEGTPLCECTSPSVGRLVSTAPGESGGASWRSSRQPRVYIEDTLPFPTLQQRRLQPTKLGSLCYRADFGL